METQTQTQNITQPNSKYYAIHQPIEFRGVYRAWDEVKKRIDTVTFNRNKSFFTQEEADYWAEHGVIRPTPEGQKSPKPLLQPVFPKTQPPPVRPAAVQLTAKVEATESLLQTLPQEQWQRPRNSISMLPEIPVKRDYVGAIQPEETKPILTNDVASKDDGVKFVDLEDVLCIPSWYAVARGKRPGLYSDWAGPGGAREQVEGFKGAVYRKVVGRTAGVVFLRSSHVPDSKIRLFARTCRSSLGPTPRATFNDEWKVYAATQLNWSPHESRKEKIDAIHAEIVRHYLPGGISENQIQDREIVLTDDQTLVIYQEMLRAARKEAEDSIYDCLHQLKAAPYVNIIDFIDARRQNEMVKTFTKWEEFKSHSLDPGHKIDTMYAKENELLAPLLHNLPKGPDSGNPISIRKRFEKKRALKNRTVEAKAVTEQVVEIEPQAAKAVSAPVPEPNLGYSAMLARWTPSPPPLTSPVSTRNPTALANNHSISYGQVDDQAAFGASEIRFHTGSPSLVRKLRPDSTAPQVPILDEQVAGPPPVPNVLVSDSFPSIELPVMEHPLTELNMHNLVPSSMPASTSDYGEGIEISQEEIATESYPTEKTPRPFHTEFRIPSSAPGSPSASIRGPSMERPDELDLIQVDEIQQTPPLPAEVQSSTSTRSSARRNLLMVRIPVKEQSLEPNKSPTKPNKRGMNEIEIEPERPRKRGRPPKMNVAYD